MKSFNLHHNKIIFRKDIMALMIIIFLAAMIYFLLSIFGYFKTDEEISQRIYSEEIQLENSNGCNVSGIKLRGNLVSYVTEAKCDEEEYVLDETASEDIVSTINIAEENNKIKAILIEIDSAGGHPIAAEEIANALKRTAKPTIVLIKGGGMSAAYYAASGADIVFASKLSDIGSIGTTMSYLDYADQNKKDGLTYNQLSTGKYKDMGNPDKPLTLDEKKLLMRDVRKLTEYFIKAVAENRNLDIEKVRELADGSSMLGEMALENGLIDMIGGFYEAKEYIKEKIGEDVEVCW